MDDKSSIVSAGSVTKDGIPLRSLVRRGGSGPGSSIGGGGLGGSSMNRKSSRKDLLSASNSRIRKISSRSKLKDSDDEASQSLLGSSIRSTDGRSTLLGEGEQEGEYDSLWKNQDDDEQALLEEGRILVGLWPSPFRTVVTC
jgi:hypothetical protein